MATLEVRSITRRFGPGAPALDAVSFTVRDGRIAAVLGGDGAGKTALARIIAGLERPDAGDVLLDDASLLALPPRARGIGLLFDDLALFSNLRVRANVEFGLRMFGWPRAERERRVDQLLEAVGLSREDGRRAVDELSNLGRYRVAIARMLAPQPSALLLDDPLGTIDEPHRAAMRIEMRAILTTVGATTVLASADLRDAVAIADDLIVLHEGRVLQTGPVSVVLGEPISAEVAELAGYVTLLVGPVVRNRVEEPGVGVIELPGIPPAGEAARVMAHPSVLLGVPAESGGHSGLTGIVLRARAIGPAWLVDIALGDRVVEARWEWDLVPPRAGSRLGIVARPGTLRVFVVAPRQAASSRQAAAPPPPQQPTAPPSEPTREPEPTARAAAEHPPERPVEDVPATPAETAQRADDVLPASATPPSRAQRHVPPSAAPREQRHRGMPLD